MISGLAAVKRARMGEAIEGVRSSTPSALWERRKNLAGRLEQRVVAEGIGTRFERKEGKGTGRTCVACLPAGRKEKAH